MRLGEMGTGNVTEPRLRCPRVELPRDVERELSPPCKGGEGGWTAARPSALAILALGGRRELPGDSESDFSRGSKVDPGGFLGELMWWWN